MKATSETAMPKSAVVRLIPIKSCLVNLPTTLYSQLSEKSVAPQKLVVELSWTSSNGKQKLSLGWTGMPARVAGFRAAKQQGASVENIELDTQFANQVNLTEGQAVNIELRMSCPAASTISITPISIDDWEILVSLSLRQMPSFSMFTFPHRHAGNECRFRRAQSSISSESCLGWTDYLRLGRVKQDNNAFHGGYDHARGRHC